MNNDCGAIYEVSAPLANACKAPTVWQSYDIDFRAPKCEGGKKTEPARITVYQNGTLIQDDVKIPVEIPGRGPAATRASRGRSCSRTTATRSSSETSGWCSLTTSDPGAGQAGGGSVAARATASMAMAARAAA